MASHRLSGSWSDPAKTASALTAHLASQGFTVDSESVSDKGVRMTAKKAGGLRDLAGMSLSFKITLSPLETDGGVLCEIQEEAGANNLLKAGLAGLVTGGATWATAGVGIAQARQAEEGVVSFLENLLSSGRPQQTPNTSISPKSDSNLAEAAKLGGSLLLKAAMAVGKSAVATGAAVVDALRMKCPNCKQPQCQEVDRALISSERAVRTAYRDNETGRLRQKKPAFMGEQDRYRYVQIQATYNIRTYAISYSCKACGHSWSGTWSREDIA